jgi:ABC-2 type transport system ATP-binding protein
MLLGLAEATAGDIRVLGHAIPREKESALPRVGALVEGPAFYPYLSGTANLIRMDSADRFSDSATRRARVAAALDRVGLTNAADKKAGQYSLGMKQRLGLANALLKPRDLLILDEPTNGLDPQGTREVRNLIRQLAIEGITIFLSSHLLVEIEQVCSHAAVMNAGELLAQGSLEELRAHGSTRVVLAVDDPAQAQAVLEAQSGAVVAFSEGYLRAEVPDDFDTAALTAALVKKKVGVREIRLERPSLEDYFVELTGEGFGVVR